MLDTIKQQGTSSPFFYSPKDIDELFERFVGLVVDIAGSVAGYADIVISENAFSSALLESSKDMQMLESRRLPDGISRPKIAGVLAFRLSRWNVISLPECLANSRELLQINYLAALAFAYDFLGIDVQKVDVGVRRELQYNLVRRHSNQETLGLCFAMLQKAYPSAKLAHT